MALTSGAKKLGLTAIVAAAIVGGWFYFTKHKVSAPKTEAPVTQTAPAAVTEPVTPVTPAPVAASETKKEQKVPAAKAKPRRAEKKTSSSPKYHNEPTHEYLNKELTDDQKALKALAGDKL